MTEHDILNRKVETKRVIGGPSLEERVFVLMAKVYFTFLF
jgi:hypothetical protein